MKLKKLCAAALAFGIMFGASGNKKHKGMALALLCDDTEREYGSMKAADKMKAACEANGWVSVSMRDDFRTIYGDDVKRADKGDNIQK